MAFNMGDPQGYGGVTGVPPHLKAMGAGDDDQDQFDRYYDDNPQYDAVGYAGGGRGGGGRGGRNGGGGELWDQGDKNGAGNRTSWRGTGSYNPFTAVNEVIPNPETAKWYKIMMALGFVNFIITFVSFLVVTTASTVNYLGFLLILPMIFPLFGNAVHIRLFAALMAFAILFGIISLFLGFAGDDVGAATVFSLLYLTICVAMLFCLNKMDPSIMETIREGKDSCLCRN